MIVNELKYPWLAAAAIAGGASNGHTTNHNSCHSETSPPLASNSPWEEWSPAGQETLAAARAELHQHGAVAFPEFLTPAAVQRAVAEMRSREDAAFTTNTEHTAYLTAIDTQAYAANSIYNHPTKTIVASTAYDELAEDSVLKELYTDPRLLQMVSSITNRPLFLSEDPLGCCSVNVFRPGYYHGFHYDESEFSVTLMLQDAQDPDSGLFQYTDPIRQPQAQSTETDTERHDLTLELQTTADVFRDHEHDAGASAETNSPATAKIFAEHEETNRNEEEDDLPPPALHTLEFRPGTLLVLAGSKSLHRVTAVKGNRSRFVAVLTFASQPGFCNTPEVQEMFWGRTATVPQTPATTNNNCTAAVA